MKGLQHNARGSFAVQNMRDKARSVSGLVGLGTAFDDVREIVSEGYQLSRELALKAGVDIYDLPKNLIGGQFA